MEDITFERASTPMFPPRLRSRLDRAVAQAILNPSRAMPTLRRAVASATLELRRHGYTDERIAAFFSSLVEDVARTRSLDSRSVLSQRPRWEELCTRVVAWSTAPELAADVTPDV